MYSFGNVLRLPNKQKILFLTESQFIKSMILMVVGMFRIRSSPASNFRKVRKVGFAGLLYPSVNI